MPPSNIAAVFDLDGTLCTGHVWTGLANYVRAHKINRRRYYPFLTSHMFLWAASRAGLVSQEQFARAWGTDMTILLKGLTLQEAREAFRAIARDTLLPTLREDVVAVLHWHQSRGHQVFLVSGTFRDLLVLMGHYLDIEHAVGSSLETRDGVLTGSLEGSFCFGPDKAKFLERYVAEQHLDIDWARSYAYADRIFDRDVLQMVGNPVAVYPDDKLRAVAEANNWFVVDAASSAVQFQDGEE